MSDVVFKNPIAANYATGVTAVDDQFHNVVLEGTGDGRHWKRTSMPLFGMRSIHQIGDSHRPAAPLLVGNEGAIQTFHKLEPFPPNAMLRLVFHDDDLTNRSWEACWIDVQGMMEDPPQIARVWSFRGDDAFIRIRVDDAHEGILVFSDFGREAFLVESSLWSVPDLRHSYL